jgi:hypothetical protein
MSARKLSPEQRKQYRETKQCEAREAVERVTRELLRPEGFRLTVAGTQSDVVHEEIGGHGPVEKLYAHAAATDLDERARKRQGRA